MRSFAFIAMIALGALADGGSLAMPSNEIFAKPSRPGSTVDVGVVRRLGFL